MKKKTVLASCISPLVLVFCFAGCTTNHEKPIDMKIEINDKSKDHFTISNIDGFNDNVFDMIACELIASAHTKEIYFIYETVPTWQQKNNAYMYTASFGKNGVLFELTYDMKPDETGLSISYTLTNHSPISLRGIYLSPCLRTQYASDFADFNNYDGLHGRAFFRRSGEWFCTKQTGIWQKLITDPKHNRANFSTAGNDWEQSGWIQAPERVDPNANLYAFVSKDHAKVVAMSFGSIVGVMGQFMDGDKRNCIHAVPYFGNMQPGQTKIVHGNIYFLADSLEGLWNVYKAKHRF